MIWECRITNLTAVHECQSFTNGFVKNVATVLNSSSAYGQGVYRLKSRQTLLEVMQMLPADTRLRSLVLPARDDLLELAVIGDHVDDSLALANGSRWLVGYGDALATIRFVRATDRFKQTDRLRDME